MQCSINLLMMFHLVRIFEHFVLFMLFYTIFLKLIISCPNSLYNTNIWMRGWVGSHHLSRCTYWLYSPTDCVEYSSVVVLVLVYPVDNRYYYSRLIPLLDEILMTQQARKAWQGYWWWMQVVKIVHPSKLEYVTDNNIQPKYKLLLFVLY